MTVLVILLASLVVEFGAGLVLAYRTLDALMDRQEVFNKYAKAVGRDSLAQTRAAEKALDNAQAAREDARALHERVDQGLAELKRVR